MYDIFFRFRDDAAVSVFGKQLLYRHCDGVHDVLAKVDLDQVLLEPVVANELALAITDLNTRIAVRFPTVQFLHVVFIIVADVLAKRRLLMELRCLPLRAIGVACVLGTFVPCLQHGHRDVGILNDHEASVCVRAVEPVRIELWLCGRPRIFCHGECVLRCDVPIVHHPLDRDVEEAEGRIGVKEHNEFVVLDMICQRRRLNPRCMPVFEILCVDHFVVVAMNLRVSVVVEDATGDVVYVTPVIFALLVGFRRL